MSAMDHGRLDDTPQRAPGRVPVSFETEAVIRLPLDRCAGPAHVCTFPHRRPQPPPTSRGAARVITSPASWARSYHPFKRRNADEPLGQWLTPQSGTG